MRFSISAPVLLAGLASVAQADVKFVSPAAGASATGGAALTVTWAESGTTPAINTFTTYTLSLIGGGNDGATQQTIQVLAQNAAFATGYTASAVIVPTAGGTGTNAYFLKMVSTSAQGGTVTNYSNRFTLTGMTGSFSAAAQAAIAALAGSTAGPATEEDLTNGGAAAGAAGTETILPYSLQTGLTRYAPMQGVPPTKITAKSATPLFPTSAFTVATTYLPLPTILTTMTATQTYSVTSHVNQAAAASQPTGGNPAKRFLERWKD